MNTTLPAVSGQRYSALALLAWPIVLGLLSQNIFNIVDMMMVGRLGETALGAVGLANYNNFMAAAALMGLSSGVQALAARRIGEGRTSESAIPLNGALLLSLLGGIPIALALWILAPYLFALQASGENQDIIDQATPYFRWRVLSVIFIGMNFSFRGFWNGISRPSVYFRSLVVIHITNIFFNWVLIFGNLGLPALGVDGAGIASLLATGVGSLIYIIQGFALASDRGFLARVPRGPSFRDLITLSIPNVLQQFFFALGFAVMFSIIARLGSTNLAAASISLNLVLVALLPGMGLGMATATKVGQAIGAKQGDEAAAWGWSGSHLAVVLVGFVGLLLAAFPDFAIGAFIQGESVSLEERTRVIEAARWAVRIVGFTIGLDAVSMVLMFSLQASGYVRPVLILSLVTQWVIFTPLAILVGPVMGGSFLDVWLLFIGYRMIQLVGFVIMWRAGKWRKVKLADDAE